MSFRGNSVLCLQQRDSAAPTSIPISRRRGERHAASSRSYPAQHGVRAAPKKKIWVSGCRPGRVLPSRAMDGTGGCLGSSAGGTAPREPLAADAAWVEGVLRLVPARWLHLRRLPRPRRRGRGAGGSRRRGGVHRGFPGLLLRPLAGVGRSLLALRGRRLEQLGPAASGWETSTGGGLTADSIPIGKFSGFRKPRMERRDPRRHCRSSAAPSPSAFSPGEAQHPQHQRD